MTAILRQLYEGETRRAIAFRYALLVFDLATILFLIGSSFVPRTPTIEMLDLAIGAVIFADFTARMTISRHRLADLIHPYGIVDVVVIASFLAPIIGEGLTFLRVARMLRLLRSYQTVRRLRRDFAFFRQHQQAIDASINLFVFVFFMTAIVYETQHATNAKIGDYADALYFTVTTLTTTGFGDITLEGTSGRMLAVVIMIFGVSLFLRLVQVLFRPTKVEHRCPTCGLNRHDFDAVHCKACGTVLNIEDEGAV